METNLDHKKQQIRDYIDFYGCKIHYEEEIDNAKSYEDLDNILSEYYKFLEYQLCDAQSHLGRFKESLFLNDNTDAKN